MTETEHSHNEHDRMNPLRFKFMPTPSGRLHVGHAWLLFVMDAFCKAARREGRDAKLVVVFDEMAAAFFGRERRMITKHAAEILDDLQRLGLQPDEIKWNGQERAAACRYQEILSAIQPNAHRIAVSSPPHCFLWNSLLDMRWGVTHIIRGTDRRSYTSSYEACYALLGKRTPHLAYIPLIGDSDGAKITMQGPYLVDQVLDHMMAEELFCVLATEAVQSVDNCSAPHDLASARDRVLGRDWRIILDESAAQDDWQPFLSRFRANPRIGIKDGRCFADSSTGNQQETCRL